MKILDYCWINTVVETPLDCTRLSLILQEAIAEIEAYPQGTKIKSEYRIDSKRTAIKQFKADLETAYKNLHYWFCTEHGRQTLEEEPEFLDGYFGSQYSPNALTPIEANCLF